MRCTGCMGALFKDMACGNHDERICAEFNSWLLRSLILSICVVVAVLSAHAHQVSVLRNGDRKPQLIVDGKPTALFFACGLNSPDELKAYKEAGFNTIWIDLAYSQGAFGQLSEIERLLEAADHEGLFAIVCIDAKPPKGISMSVHDERYISFVQQWLTHAVKKLSRHRNIVAWAVANFADECAIDYGGYDDNGFRSYLIRTYGDLKALSIAFGVPISNLSALTQEAAMHIDDLQSPIHYGHASLSGAIYRWSSLRWLLWLLGKTIRDADSRPLLTGLLSTYRSIASVPPIYDGIVTATFPYACEPDLQSHNAHSVSIGRRGNASIVIPVLASQLGKSTISLSQLIHWVQLSALNGACGIGFNSWQPFKSDEQLRKGLSELLSELSEAGIWHATPITHAAILYIPFAEGVVQDGVPLYGYATPHGHVSAQPQRLILGEPNALFSAFKLGTRYGQLDCLTVDSLQHINPSRYSLILMPSPLFISPHVVGQTGELLYGFGMPMPPHSLRQLGLSDESLGMLAQWLMSFVANGGVLLSDIGASLSPAGEPFRLMPHDFAKLFGVAGARLLIADTNLALGMSILFRHPLFPSLPEGYILGDGEMPFRTVAAVLRFMGAHPYALMMRAPRRTRRITSEAVAMCINQFGNGFAIYAPTLLWANWNPTSKSFEAFHSDLLRRGSQIELLSSPNLIGSRLSVALFDRGIAVVNSSNATQLASISVNANVFGAATLTSACTEFPMGANSASVIIRRHVQPLELAFIKALPIAVDCKSRFVAVVQKYAPDGIAISLYGSDATVGVADGRLTVSATKPTKFALTISSGEYEVKPNSKHIVSISSSSGRMLDIDTKPIEGTAIADADGKLKFEVSGAIVHISVRSAIGKGAAKDSTAR